MEEVFLSPQEQEIAQAYANGDNYHRIVDQLFIGNRLATAELTTGEGVRIDLRNIRSPILCFASEGDNITPPQQALGWIVDLYEDDDDILADLLHARHENGEPLDDQEIRDAVVTSLAAGHETTATALAWAFEQILPNQTGCWRADP